MKNGLYMMKFWKIWLSATVLLFAFTAGSASALSSNETRLTLVRDSPYSFEETLESLRNTIRAHNFRVFPDRYLEQGLTDEFSVNERQVSVRFCNFHDLYEALQIEPQIGVVLPCTITVVEQEDGSVQLLTANVQAMMTVFDNEKLEKAFRGIEAKYEAILDEVTL